MDSPRCTPKKTGLTAADFLNDKILPFFDEHCIKILRILTDNGTEYCGIVSSIAVDMHSASVSSVTPEPSWHGYYASEASSFCCISCVSSRARRRSDPDTTMPQIFTVLGERAHTGPEDPDNNGRFLMESLVAPGAAGLRRRRFLPGRDRTARQCPRCEGTGIRENGVRIVLPVRLRVYRRIGRMCSTPGPRSTPGSSPSRRRIRVSMTFSWFDAWSQSVPVTSRSRRIRPHGTPAPIFSQTR